MNPCKSLYAILCALTSTLLMQQPGSAGEAIPRPVPEPFKGEIGLTPRDSTAHTQQDVLASKDAPNILVILTDDVGFGASSVFGGPVETPTFEALAKDGVRFNQFHTTAICSPTRSALLAGRNHHSAHTGLVVDARTDYPGYDGRIGGDTATVAEVLKQTGYSTAWFGKNHNVPLAETSAAGPFDRWPNRMGFDYFYGFLAGETNQYAPVLWENTRPVEPAVGKEDYHFNTDMRDRAIAWLETQKTIYPDKPVFMYYAPGATHTPHHVFNKWTEPYKGRFDKGWDALRRDIYENQKRLGVIPADAVLTPMSPGIPAWETLADDERRLHARMMEVYAGFLAQTDYSIGEVVDAFKAMGLYDNTLVIYIQGDNGASAEAHMGAVNELVGLVNALPDEFTVTDEMIDGMGGPEYFSNYAAGWATALCTLFQWSKGTASHYGGTRNGMVVSWPKRHRDQAGGLRSQWHHVVDITPTLLEAAGLTMPDMVNGVAQKPLEGVSMLYSLEQADAPSRHTGQYFETMANVAYYRDGWVVATAVRITPWKQIIGEVGTSPASWEWELYNVENDFSQSDNLAAQNPVKLREMQMLFFAEAGRRNVLPLSDNPLVAMGVPATERKEWTFSQGFGRLPEGAAPVFRNRSYSIRADVHIDEGREAEGMLLTLGGQFGGLALFMEKGKPVFIYNYLAIETFEMVGPDKLAPGDHDVEVVFTYAGGGEGKGGDFELRVDGTRVAEGSIARSVPKGFSLGDSLDVGQDTGTPIVQGRYALPFAFTDTLRRVKVELE